MEDLAFANENKAAYNEMIIRFLEVTKNTKFLTIFTKFTIFWRLTLR